MYILFFTFLLAHGNPIVDAAYTNTLQECDHARALTPAVVAKYNAAPDNEDNPIVGYAASCAPVDGVDQADEKKDDGKV